MKRGARTHALRGLLILISLLVLLPACARSPQEKAARHIESAKGYLASERHREAAIEFKNALQADPRSAEAHYGLGLAYLKLGGLSNLKLAFGEFSIADAMFAPVVGRFRTYRVPMPESAQAYCDAIWAWPAVQEWVAAAKNEPRIPRYDVLLAA